MSDHTHLTDDGNFKSDKYDWCPEGFLALKFTDHNARVALTVYAELIKNIDHQLSQDILDVCAREGLRKVFNKLKKEHESKTNE